MFAIRSGKRSDRPAADSSGTTSCKQICRRVR
jgi:hypothetical protein